MSDLVVLAFKGERDAAAFSSNVKRMQQMSILSLEDAAIVTRDLGGKVKVKQANSLVGAGAFGGAFWGMLIGLLFWMPWLGLAVGAISGALAGKFSDIGIDDKFIKEVGSEIKPGSSAMFLMVAGATPDRVLEELRGNPDVKVLQTSLSREAEEHLREALATPTRDESGESMEKAG
ncbi:MAG TPA: DUF1269 domain-containing protein [Dehalococcoidia bacterium]|jgi:uncharacterized membrane protein|nr:DUF1269 domain-containing protein [Dehalococcoidia bacterium]